MCNFLMEIFQFAVSFFTFLKDCNDCSYKIGPFTDTVWDEYIEKIVNSEQIQDGNGREMLKSQKDELMSKYDELQSDGSLEDLDKCIASSISKMNNCLTEKFEIESQFEKLQQIIDERNSIKRRIELENRIEKNKWQAQKNRLLSLISSAKND